MESYLLISGIQHYLFCPRQWGLIHIEHQWAENSFTVEGDVLHSRVHDSDSSFKRGELLSLTSMRVSSERLGIEGVCDAVEFRSASDGVELFGRSGKWMVMPVEYKRGGTKRDECDIMQVVAQALCLEEMFGCRIERGAIYYGKTRSRDYFEIDDDLRKRLISTVEEMHRFYDRHCTPKARRTKKCSNCSLLDICIPSIFEDQSVSEYVQSHIKDSG